MKKIFLLFLLLLLGFQDANAMKLENYGIIIEQGDKIENSYSIIENNKQIVKYIWNKYTKQFGKISNEKSCEYLQKTIDGKIENIPIRTFLVSIGCYVNNKGTHKTSIYTTKEENRNWNIEKGLGYFKGIVMKKGEVISTNGILSPHEREYKEGDILYYDEEEDKIKTRKEKGGGLCGISTGLYQNFMKRKDIDIVQRRGHANYYYHYYGNNLGNDATIYFGGVDFKFSNNSDTNIYLDYDTEWTDRNFVYYTITKSLGFKERNVKTYGTYNNNGKTCARLDYGNEKTYSCYENVY